jgi:hypothetical protein
VTQVVGQAIRETGGVDDEELADYTSTATFPTVVGDVKLGTGNSLLARDPDGMLAEFIEISGGTA